MRARLFKRITIKRPGLPPLGKFILTIPTWLVFFGLATDTLAISSSIISLVLTAFLIIMWPGLLILLLLQQTRPNWIDNISLSFGLSGGVCTIPAIAVLWTSGNLTQFIRLILAVTLVFSISALYLELTRYRTAGSRNFTVRKTDAADQISKVYLGGVLLSVIVLTLVFTNIDPVHPGTDRLTYTAFLRHFLDADRFFERSFILSPDFQSSFSARMQTQTWLVILAAIIRVSNAGMLDTYAYYLPPLLGIISILVFFSFARFLFQDEKTAGLAVLIQSLYVLSDTIQAEGIGFGFFLRIIEDKYFVLFLMLPLALWTSIEAYTNSKVQSRNSLIIPILILVGLVPIHPMAFPQFGFSFSLFFLLSLWSGDRKERLMRAAPIFAATFLLALIPLWQRQSVAAELSFSIEEGLDELRSRRLLVLSDQLSLFIASPKLLAHPLAMLSIFITPFVVRRVRSDIAAQFLFSNMIGLLILGYTPVLTSFIGRFISPWMIWRMLWLLPVSLTIAFGFSRLMSLLSGRFPRYQSIADFVTPIVIILVGSTILYPWISSSLSKLAERSARAVTQEEKAVLYFLRDYGTPGSYILTPDEHLSSEIPGFIGHSYGLTFRTNDPFYPTAVEDRAWFYSNSLITQEHLDILSRYTIDYLIVKSGSEVERQLRWMPDSFHEIFTNKDYWVIAWEEARLKETDRQIIQGNTYLLSGRDTAAELTYAIILEDEPDNPLAHWGLAQIYESQLNNEEAIKHYELALTKMARDPSIYIRLAELRQVQSVESDQNAETVINYYLHALALNPRSAENINRVLESVSKLPISYHAVPGFNELRKALRDFFEQRAEAHPYHLSIQRDLAQAYVKLDLESKAVDQYSRMIQRFPDTPNPYLELAKLLTDQGQIEEAIKIYGQALAISEKPSIIYLRFAQLYRQLGDLESAQQYAERALLAASDPEQQAQARVEIGDIYFSQGEIQKARVEFQAALNLNPLKADYHVRLGDVFQQLETWDQAISHYRQAVALPPDHAWHHYKLGAALLAAEEFEEGSFELERALALRNDATYLWLVGAQYSRNDAPEQALTYLQRAQQMEPDNLQIKVTLASVLRMLGEFETALALTQALASSDDEQIARDAHLELARIYQAQNEPGQALEHYLALIKLNPTSPGNYESAGNMYFQLGDLENAISHYKSAVSLPPDWPSKHLALGEALLANGQADDGVQELQRVAVLFPDAGIYPSIGNLYLKYLAPDRALELVRELTKSDPQNGLNYLTLARLESDLGYFATAAASAKLALSILIESEDRALAYAELGLIYQSMGRTPDAEEMLIKAVNLEPEKATFHLKLADFYLSQGDHSAAITHYRQAVTILPEEAWIRVLLGSAHLEAGSAQEGLEEYNKAIALRPEAEIYYQIGTRIAKFLTTEEAVSYLQEAARLDPENWRVRLNLAQFYRQRTDYPLALDYALEASLIRKNPEEAALVHEELGNIHREQGNFEEALAQYDRAVEAHPTIPRYHLHAGDMEGQLGNLERALEYYQKAIELPPDWAWKHYVYGAALLEAGNREDGVFELNRAVQMSETGDEILRLVDLLFQQYDIP